MTLPDWTSTEQFLSLTTFRRSGEGVPTPMWFVVDGDRLVMQTAAGSPKVRRITNIDRVEIAPCTRTGKATGPAVTAHARERPDDLEQVRSLMAARYGWQYRLLHGVQSLSGRLRRRPPAALTTLEVSV